MCTGGLSEGGGTVIGRILNYRRSCDTWSRTGRIHILGNVTRPARIATRTEGFVSLETAEGRRRLCER